MLHDGELLDVFADPPVVLPVTLLVLIEIIFIRKEPEHCEGPVLELVEQGCCLAFLDSLEAFVMSMR